LESSAPLAGRVARVVECLEAGGESMSHRGVEIVLGRLATDEAMRRRFRQSPSAALRELLALGIELSAVELAALQSLDPSALSRFAQALDPRLQKAMLVSPMGDDPADGKQDEA
jgi:hypothetical protein